MSEQGFELGNAAPESLLCNYNILLALEYDNLESSVIVICIVKMKKLRFKETQT